MGDLWGPEPSPSSRLGAQSEAQSKGSSSGYCLFKPEAVLHINRNSEQQGVIRLEAIINVYIFFVYIFNTKSALKGM